MIFYTVISVVCCAYGCSKQQMLHLRRGSPTNLLVFHVDLVHAAPIHVSFIHVYLINLVFIFCEFLIHGTPSNSSDSFACKLPETCGRGYPLTLLNDRGGFLGKLLGSYPRRGTTASSFWLGGFLGSLPGSCRVSGKVALNSFHRVAPARSPSESFTWGSHVACNNHQPGVVGGHNATCCRSAVAAQHSPSSRGVGFNVWCCLGAAPSGWGTGGLLESNPDWLRHPLARVAQHYCTLRPPGKPCGSCGRGTGGRLGACRRLGGHLDVGSFASFLETCTRGLTASGSVGSSRGFWGGSVACGLHIHFTPNDGCRFFVAPSGPLTTLAPQS